MIVLERFQNRHKFKQQDSPRLYTAPKYGRTTQFAPNIPDETEITEDENKFLEQVLGDLLYNGMNIYCTMLVAINSIAVNKNMACKKP